MKHGLFIKILTGEHFTCLHSFGIINYGTIIYHGKIFYTLVNTDIFVEQFSELQFQGQMVYAFYLFIYLFCFLYIFFHLFLLVRS